MRRTIVMRSGTPSAGLRRPREGVILIVVLALLTLFTLIGISFVLYADTAKKGTRQFREETFAIAHETLDMAEVLGRDLVRLEHEEVDLRPHLERIDDLSSHVICLKKKVREARDREPDPAAWENLDALIDDIELFEAGLKELRRLIDEIRLGE
ncbi:MAG TPA: hypothetical protein VKD71_09965 [Gemmataceae bacterium]|nr:hypothetical protein [Gemmataceae bacterium]